MVRQQEGHNIQVFYVVIVDFDSVWLFDELCCRSVVDATSSTKATSDSNVITAVPHLEDIRSREQHYVMSCESR